MHPVLFQWGNFFISTYGVMIAIGLCLGAFVAVNRGKRVGIDSATILDIIFYCALAGIIGGRLVFILLNFGIFLEDPFGVAFSRAGFVFLGSVISAMIVGFSIAHKRGLKIWTLGDAIITAVPLAHAFGRIGCFLSGCCYGSVVNPDSPCSALGVCYPEAWQVGNQMVGSTAHSYHQHLGLLSAEATQSLPVFPVQIVESFGNLLIFLLLMWLWRRRRFEGQIFVVYLVAYGVLRFLDEFMRGDPDRGGMLGLSTSQLLSLVGIGFALALWRYLKRTHPVRVPLRQESGKNMKPENGSGEKA